VRSAASVNDAPNLTPPPGNPRFPLLDAARALAALAVFAGHTVTGTYTFAANPHLFGWAAQLAYQGVALFFLISGFLLYRPFLIARRGGRPLRARDYARRRVLRIVPAYWAALTVFIALGFVTGVTTHNWWIFYGFGQIYSPRLIGQGIGVAWTLCIEVTFYAALPVIAFVAARLSRERRSLRGDVILLTVLSAASLAFRAHYSSFSDVATVSTLPGTFLWFALGMGMAVRSVAAEGRPPPEGPARLPPGAWPLLSWLAAAIAFFLLHELAANTDSLGATAGAVSTHILYGVAAMFILLPAVSQPAARGAVPRLLRTRTLAWVGLVSYAFYLYHTIVIAQLEQLASNDHIAARYLFVATGGLLISLACAAASYYMLERPAMRIGRSSRSLQPRTSPPS
jgi:peptidoglycan/LPS O-acetylase OafA/YrhL